MWRLLTYIVIVLSTFAIYQAKEHSWKPLCVAEPGMQMSIFFLVFLQG